MYEEEFVNRLTKLRIQKGVSARDMSINLGQSESYINKIESNLLFFYICEYFEITPAQFFDDEIKNPELMNKIIENMKHLNDEQLKHINNIIEDIKR